MSIKSCDTCSNRNPETNKCKIYDAVIVNKDSAEDCDDYDKLDE